MQQRSDDADGRELLWDAETKRRVQADFDASLVIASAVTHEAFAMLDGRQALDAAKLLRAFLLGAGEQADPERYRISDLTDQVGRAQGILAADERFFHHPWLPKREAVQVLCPDLVPLLFEARGAEGLEILPLLDPCTNESLDLSFPPRIGQLIRRPTRPGLLAYASASAIAYVHPFQYQVLSADASAMWVTGSPRYLTRTFLRDLEIEVTDRTIVIAQDRFVFSNLCHFLFDGLTRVLHYASRFGIRGDETFVFGAIPGEYQALLCATLCREMGIPPEAILFPQGPRLLKGRRCVWFSDQIEAHSHPAQMVHPRSVAALARLCAGVDIPAGAHKRLYVSRGDAARRRVHNEADLIAALSANGFQAVQLAGMPAAEQISLFRGAELVVAPHGQGLSHLIMGQRLGRIIELFHPTTGTDAYAWMARAGRIEYQWVLGTEVEGTPGDFMVDVAEIVRMVADGVKVARPAFDKAANLIPSSRNFEGFIAAMKRPPALAEHWLIWGEQAVRHQARENGPAALEVGRWPHIEVGADQAYTVSCWVLLPAGIDLRSVELAIGDWPGQTRLGADPGARDVWQRISTTAATPATRHCFLSLLIEAAPDAIILSTCWQFESGRAPSAYVATA